MTLEELEARQAATEAAMARLEAAMAKLAKVVALVVGDSATAEAGPDPLREGFRAFRARARASLARRSG